MSIAGPPYDDVVPFGRALVEHFPDRVIWGTDWPHPNMKKEAPDDGVLVDYVPKVAPDRGATTGAAGRQSDAALLALAVTVTAYPAARSRRRFKDCGDLRCQELASPRTYVAKIACAIYVKLNGRTPMAREQHDYDDIPGTFVFDQERSRQGFGINMFCMSLMKDENRKAFKADEAEYLEEFNLTPEQTRRHPQARLQPHAGAWRQHLFHRQARRDRRPFVPAPCRGDDRVEPGRLRQMMLAGGRSVEGNRSRSGKVAKRGRKYAKGGKKAGEEGRRGEVKRQSQAQSD